MNSRILTVPNQLTFLRLAFLPFFIIAIHYERYNWGLVILIVAGFTDGLDGFLARGLNQKTPLGAYLDPIADKLLLSSSYLVLALKGKMAGGSRFWSWGATCCCWWPARRFCSRSATGLSAEHLGQGHHVFRDRVDFSGAGAGGVGQPRCCGWCGDLRLLRRGLRDYFRTSLQHHGVAPSAHGRDDTARLL